MNLNYQYVGIDASGKRVSGQSSAADIQALHRQLFHQQISIISVKSSPVMSLWTVKFKNRLVTSRSLQDWCFQLHLLLKSGVVIVNALQFIIDQRLSPALDHVSGYLLLTIKQGHALSLGLQQFPSCFDTVFVSLIQMGEKTGTLVSCLEHLLHYLSWQQKFKEQVTRALIYPVMLGSIMIVMVSILFITLIPQMQQFLIQQNQKLPLSTELLIATSDWFDHYSTGLICGLLGMFIIIHVSCILSLHCKIVRDRCKLLFPKLGDMLDMIEAERFTFTLQILYKSGIDIIDSLNHARLSIKNSWLKVKIQKVIDRIKCGELLSTALIQEHVFQTFLAKIISIGEKSGHLDDALSHAEQFYLRNLQRKFELIAATIGPVFIILLGLILVWVALAIFVPLYDHITVML